MRTSSLSPVQPQDKSWRPATISLLGIVLLLAPLRLYAVQPIHHFHDLVAGEGLPGFRDGAFAQARFNHPVGIAQSEDGTRLFVADRDNHRIRIVRLDRFNTVETLCGTGEAGYRDGPLAQAAFHSPSQLLSLPGGRLLLFDFGNAVFRLIDLKQHTVSTLQAGSDTGGAARPLQATAAWGVVYDAKTQTLYYSEPGAGKLRRYEFTTRRVADVVWAPPGPAQPAALGLWQDHLFVSDRTKPDIYRLTPIAGAAADQPQFTLNLMPAQGPVVAFATGPVAPVALRGTAPYWIRIQPQPSRELPVIDPVTTEGQLFSDQPEALGSLLSVNPDLPAGFIEDRRAERAYFLASTGTHAILALTDYRFEALQKEPSNSAGMSEFEYPPTKPPNTTRILLLGDSRTYQIALMDEFNKMLALPNQLGLVLNTRSALEDRGMQFQVLGRYERSWSSLPLWPYYVVPPLVTQYDIDLIAMVSFPAFNITDYFDRPLTKEGIPGPTVDPEFMLINIDTRLPPGPARDFFELCRRKKLVQTTPEGQLQMQGTAQLIADPEVRRAMIDIVAPPMRLLGKKLADLNKGRPRPVRMILYYTPLLVPHIGPEADHYRETWQLILQGTGIEFADLTAPVRALTPTYFPIADPSTNTHPTQTGYHLLAEVIASDLLDHRRLAGAAPVSAR